MGASKPAGVFGRAAGFADMGGLHFMALSFRDRKNSGRQFVPGSVSAITVDVFSADCNPFLVGLGNFLKFRQIYEIAEIPAGRYDEIMKQEYCQKRNSQQRRGFLC